MTRCSALDLKVHHTIWCRSVVYADIPQFVCATTKTLQWNFEAVKMTILTASWRLVAIQAAIYEENFFSKFDNRTTNVAYCMSKLWRTVRTDKHTSLYFLALSGNVWWIRISAVIFIIYTTVYCVPNAKQEKELAFPCALMVLLWSEKDSS